MPPEPDPLAEVHRLLDQQEARTWSWVLAPLIFGFAALGALLVAELPELAATLGAAALLSGAVGGLLTWDRRRKLRQLRAILDPHREPPTTP